MANKSFLKNFTESMEWMEWKAKLINFLKSKPVRNGVPLNYVIRENVAAIVRTNGNFLDDYVDMNSITERVLCQFIQSSFIHLLIDI